MQYEFGAFSFDTESRVLSGDAGEIVLRPKVFALLSLLIAERNRIVSKEELFEQIWPGVFVGDATLNTCIKQARHAVGDSGELQAVIRTFHGHGYRFVAPVREQDDSEAALSGEPLPDSAPPASPAVPPGSAEGTTTGREHKQVTVFDCALCDAVHLAETLGPEAMDDLAQQVVLIAERCVERYGGTTTQRRGDGIVALFGAPRAYEDHAWRSVAAALDAVAETSRDAPGATIAVGLHSGPVIVGPAADDPTRIFTAVGETTIGAQSLRQAAAGGGIYASDDTHALVQGEVTADPPEDMNGVFVISGLESPAPGVTQRGGRALSHFVGRDRELAMIRDRLDIAARGDGQVIGIVGDPGVGKTRLIDEFERSAGHQVRIYRTRCLSYATASPYMPIRRLVRQFCGAKDNDVPEQTAQKLLSLLGEAGLDSSGTVALFAQALDLPLPRDAIADLDAEDQRAQIFDRLYDLVAHVVGRRPVVIVFEDAHWIDATTEAWLSRLITRLSSLNLLLLVSSRPGYQAPWLTRPGVTQIALAQLTPDDGTQLVQSLGPGADMTAAEIATIVAKAQGNPFFLEELTWSMASGQLDHDAVPQTVQAVLAARIDQLSVGDKRLLQIASVIGAEIRVSLLALVDDMTDAERQAAIERLQAADFLHEGGMSAERILVFKHALTEDVAYLGLVSRERQSIHRRVADALAAEFPALARSRPELLAFHLSEAGETVRAIEQWRLAGRHACERSADREAIDHFDAALSLTDDLPDDDAKVKQQLGLLLDLGVSLQNVYGQGAAAVGQVYLQANGLTTKAGSFRQKFQALWGLWTHRQSRGELNAAKALSLRLIEIADEDPELLLQAHHAAWTSARIRGEHGEALEHSAAGVAMSIGAVSSPPFYPFGGHDPVVCALGARAIALWQVGQGEQSASELADSLSRSEQIAHPVTTAHALVNAVELHLMQRDVTALAGTIGPLRDISDAHDFAMAGAVGEFAQGWYEYQSGPTRAGIDHMEQALSRMKSLGRIYQEPYYVALLAEATAAVGRGEQARAQLHDVLDGLSENGKHHWAEAEVIRLDGHVVLTSFGDSARAEDLFRQAIAVCQAQGALALELRTTVSLGQLLAESGREKEAVSLLNQLIERFPEPPQGPDAKLASALFPAALMEAYRT